MKSILRTIDFNTDKSVVLWARIRGMRGFFCVLSFVLFLVSCSVNGQSFEKIKGVCWVASDSVSHQNFDVLIENNVEWISQTPFAYMPEYNKPELTYSGTREGSWGGNDVGLIHTTKLAHHCGIKVILKPHIWLRNRDGKWRSDIAMASQKEWDEWFGNYSKMILHYAQVAEEGSMDALCIGTEILQASTFHENAWRELIHKIRNVYSGQLTYAANFYKEYENIKFWDALDFIGVQAYFPLSSKTNPSVNDLKKAWKKPMKKMKRLADKYKKPIVFTEVGYRNTIDAAKEPWLWPRQVDPVEGIISEEMQAKCYQALFESLWSEEWFGGVYIWKWFHGGHSRTYEEYIAYRRQRMKERFGDEYEARARIAFSPQMKKAQQVMSNWFSR